MTTAPKYSALWEVWAALDELICGLTFPSDATIEGPQPHFGWPGRQDSIEAVTLVGALANPTDDNWSDLLKRVLSNKNFNQRLTLELFRLQAMAVKVMAVEEYVEMIELDLIQGFPTEAKKMLDAGYANGVLGVGSDAPKHKKLRDQANKAAADDVKTW